MPPPSTLGFAVGRIVGVVVWLPLEFEFEFEEFPLFVGEGAEGVMTWVMGTSIVLDSPLATCTIVLVNIVVKGVVAAGEVGDAEEGDAEEGDPDDEGDDD